MGPHTSPRLPWSACWASLRDRVTWTPWRRLLFDRNFARARPKGAATQTLPSREELKALIEEATVDCYNEYEQICGLYTCLEENLKLPFATQVLGLRVEVRSLVETESDIVAECYRGQHCQRVSLRELPLPDPMPLGAEWILALRQWHG